MPSIKALSNFDRPASLEVPKSEEDQIIGFDGAVEQLSQLLAGGSEQFEVISIVGEIGNEKTTLAKKVLRNPIVDYEFKIQAFVHVSKEYEKKEVLLKILGSFAEIDDELEGVSEDQLEKQLHEKLRGNQYLVILDDVFEEEDWNRLEQGFPRNNKRCRVLITTCNKKVAEKSNPRIPFYHLAFLSADKNTELFRRKVFGYKDCPQEFQAYEIEIVEKCRGFPLATVVIAGVILNHGNNVDWWKFVAERIKDFDVRDQKKFMEILEFMIIELPNYLKPCFLYLGIFPEDFEIPVWKLLRLWIAEGFIQEEAEDLNLENIAEKYLEELVCRNLLMVGKRKSNGRIKTCRIHETILQFCKNKAMRENLFQEITEDNVSFFLSGNQTLDQYHRLCINNANIHEYISDKPSGKCVRSFLTFPKEQETIVEPKFVSSIPKAFKLVSVLEIESLTFTRYPLDLNRLLLLKYIAISSNFSALPSVMSNLRSLQTLIVKTSFRTLEIKADLRKMPKLRHVHTNSSTILPCPNVDENQRIEEGSIQTLSTISPGSCRKGVFDHTPKLKKLGIYGALHELFEVYYGESSLFGNLGKLEFLENLKLLNNDLKHSRLFTLPSEKSFPKKLTELTLEGTFLNWKEMSTLGKLENLEILKLKGYAFEGKLWKTQKGGFSRLNYLQIGTTNLETWEEASADHFPKLSSLVLRCCDKLQALPEGMADILSLQSVVLHCINPSLASSAMKLQMLKLDQAQDGDKSSSFKLFVYPPDAINYWLCSKPVKMIVQEL